MQWVDTERLGQFSSVSPPLFTCVCSCSALLFTEPRCNRCRCLCVCVDPRLFWVHRLSTWSWLGLPGWHRDHLVRAHRAPLRCWSRAGWEWLMGQQSDTLRGSASDLQPAPLLRCHPTQPAQWRCRLYTQHAFLGVTYPTYPLCHFPLSPPEKH